MQECLDYRPLPTQIKGKALDKIIKSFIIKIHDKHTIKKNFINLIKGNYKNTKTNIISNGEAWKTLGKRQECFSSLLLFSTILETLASKDKNVLVCINKEIKSSLFPDNLTAYTESLKKSIN